MSEKTTSRIALSVGFAAMIIASVGAWEGKRNKAYWDSYGRVWTVCYGETRGVKKGDYYTNAECDAMLAKGLIDFELGVQRCLIEKGRRIPDKSYMSFVDLAYNAGTGTFCRSSVRTYANRYMRSGNMGDLAEACRRLKRYVKAGGRTVKGLVNRRNDMYNKCMAGVREKVVTGVESDAKPAK